MSTPVSSETSSAVDRRNFLLICSAVGLGGTALPAALWTRLEAEHVPMSGEGSEEGLPVQAEVTVAMLAAAEGVAGVTFTPAEREMMLRNLNRALAGYGQIRAVPIDNGIPPAIQFSPMIPGLESPKPPPAPSGRGRPAVSLPASESDLAFLQAGELGELIRTRQVSSVELTSLYLKRLRRHTETLHCAVTITEERALRQARAADAEIAAGRYRGPLHGVPWGGKDLLAVDGYPTTWGSPIYRDRVLRETATVVEKLDAAGAVLVAKLSLGEMAQGDVWFGGMTRNPWKTDQGSSGSSAGSASATVAGLVGFSIGSETLGSIVSPSTRCGASGLRPTFGRVSRAGAMALSWSMDKLGPLCRSAEDCALVLDAIHGADGKDLTAVDRPFVWDRNRPLSTIRVGYLQAAFEQDRPTREYDEATLDMLRQLGVNLVPITIPSDLPLGALRIILTAEAGAAFEELVLTNRDDEMVQQTPNAWPNTFRSAQMIPAVSYIQANRIRTMAMVQLEEAMRSVDCFVTPSFGGNVLMLTNLTGHPTVVVPNGYREDGTPVSISFIGRLFGESEALTVAHHYQEETGWNRMRPPAFA